MAGRSCDAGALTPLERARAGQTLARLGDPREGVGVKDGLPDIKWSDPIPAGPFPMGNSKETDPEAYDDEAPRHDEEIKEPYCISVYPITNAQYDAFVQDGGYTGALEALLDCCRVEVEGRQDRAGQGRRRLRFAESSRCVYNVVRSGRVLQLVEREEPDRRSSCPPRRSGNARRGARMAAATRGTARSRPTTPTTA